MHLSSTPASASWLLLIYTVPSEPSRKRAYVWRELKRLGAAYLRDGVALLPDQAALAESLDTVARRIHEYGGIADVVRVACFPPSRQRELVERFRHERSAEYQEVYHASVRFLHDVLSDVRAEEFGFPDVDKLESELARLRRWEAQIEVRDYFGAGAMRVNDILVKCQTAFERFVSEAAERGPHMLEGKPEDVYEFLGGPAGTPSDDTPL